MRGKTYLCFGAFIFFSFSNFLSAQIKSSAIRQINSLNEEKNSRTPAQKKLDSQLWYAVKMDRGEMITAEVPSMDIRFPKDDYGRVLVIIHSEITNSVLLTIKDAGGEIVFSSAEYKNISARISLSALEAIAGLSDVNFISPQYPLEHGNAIQPTTAIKNNFSKSFEQRSIRVRQQLINSLIKMGYIFPDIGGATSLGDTKHNAALARTTFSINGAGIKIGVLSDSYDTRVGGTNAADDILSGDLPGPGNPNGFITAVTVLADFANGTDEGRAMLQIIHDIAPGAQLYFATANPSEAAFAANILSLQAAGCQIICDDVSYFDEPVFQDGIIAQAVNTVTTAGVLYFASAGNAGNKNDGTSGVWEGDFLDAGTNTVGTVTIAGGTVHNFGGGVTNNLFTLANGGRPIGLFWSDPQGGSANDYDLYILDNALTTVISAATTVQSGTQDPIELSASSPSVGRQFVIFKKTGASIRALHLNAFRGRLNINTSGQTHAHSSAAAAFAVAATQAIGAGAFNTSNSIETFSSDGPRRKFYNPNGTQIGGGITFSSGGGALLQKPDITAADGVTTTVPGFSSFFGTSAAAPHAAAIAALIKQANSSLTAAQVRTTIINSAIDIEAAGTDRDAGYGIIMAYEAVNLIANCTISCPVNITVSNDLNQCGAVVNYSSPTTTGTCGPIIKSPASGSFFPVGTTTVTASASAGPSCTFTVTVQDIQAPSITCPANITVANTVNQCGAIVNFATPAATDNCPGVTVFTNPVSGSFFPVGTTTVTVTAQDASPNSPDATCTFTVTVQDTQAPGVTCPANITTSNTVNQCGAIVNFATPVATDNCPGVTVGAIPASGSFFPVGTTTVTVTAQDASPNSPNTTCTFTITVNDTQAPSVTCPSNITTTNAINQCGAVVNFATPVATDNCPGVTVMAIPASGSFFPVGTTTVTVTAQDASPASADATCTFTVTVNDTQAPSITCPVNQTVTANNAGCTYLQNSTSLDPAVTDNCPNPNKQYSLTGATNGTGSTLNGRIFNLGTTTINWTSTDQAGNTSACNFNLTVNNATTGSISGTTTVGQNGSTSSPVIFTGIGGIADYCFTYDVNVNGAGFGAPQTICTSGGQSSVTINQSNATIGTFQYRILSVTDANGCPGTLTGSTTATINVIAGGIPDLTSSQFFTTTQIAEGGMVDEVIAIRNVGTAPTSGLISIGFTNYSPLSGLTVSQTAAGSSVVIGIDTYVISGGWTFNAGTGTLTTNNVIPPGGNNYIGLRITRGVNPNQGANGSVTQTTTVQAGTGGGEAPSTNNSISNSILKN